MWRTRVAGFEPIVLQLDAGATVWWCGCAKASPSPDCSAEHVEGRAPTPVRTIRAGWVWLCACGASGTWPACDGSHRSAPAPERLAASDRRTP